MKKSVSAKVAEQLAKVVAGVPVDKDEWVVAPYPAGSRFYPAFK